MAKVRATATCYMPSQKSDVKFDRYEDEFEGNNDIYDIPGNRLDEFLATGNFVRVKGG